MLIDSAIGKESFNFKSKSYASKARNRFIFKPNMLNRKQPVIINKERKQPIEIQRGYIQNDEYRIKYPKGFSISFLPIESLLKKYSQPI